MGRIFSKHYLRPCSSGKLPAISMLGYLILLALFWLIYLSEQRFLPPVRLQTRFWPAKGAPPPPRLIWV